MTRWKVSREFKIEAVRLVTDQVVAVAQAARACRVWRDVLGEGRACGLHRIERLMRINALRARPGRR